MPQRQSPLRLCLRVDEVPQPFDSRQVEFAAQKGPLRELTRFGGPQAGELPQPRQNRAHHGWRSVNMQLDHVFAGKGTRAGKPGHHGLVENPTFSIEEIGAP